MARARITRKREAKTLYCRFRPNRSPESELERRANAAAAARFACKAIEYGATRAQIDRAITERCPQQGRRDKLADAAAMAEAALLQSNLVLTDAISVWTVVGGLLAALLAIITVLRFAGPLRLLAIPGRVAVQRASGQVALIVQRQITARAANDAAIIALRRAA